MAYTGRKLNEYIWIPKSKTDLKEYREFLKICDFIEKKNGFFSDKTIGHEMVSLRAIVDRDNSADSYIEKYKDKSIGDQSYVSNARMLIRILRWLGYISKDYDPEVSGKFYLTPYGRKFVQYRGPIKKEEVDMFRVAFARMRYFSQNDDILYRNYDFKQRPFFNLIRFLKLLEFASHYELALSALVLKNEEENEIKDKLNKIKECRKDKSIRWLMREYGLDCANKSTVTGIYDGPKVLLSFAKQMGLAEEIDLHGHENTEIYSMYKRMYKGSGQISEKSAKKITTITELGKKFVDNYEKNKLVWFDDLSSPTKQAAIIITCLKNGFVKTDKLSLIGITPTKLDGDIFIKTSERIFLCGDIDFDLYRDVPYEKREAVKTNGLLLGDNFLEEQIDASQKQIFIKDAEKNTCKECYYGKCAFYKDKIDSFGGSDRFASRVCPNDLLKFNQQGVLQIEEEECVGCGLCALNCPFGALFYNDRSKFHKKTSQKNGKMLDINKKEAESLEIEKQAEKTNTIDFDDIPKLVNEFIERINNPDKKWGKDKCYTYIRNAFRIFGVDAIYSGSGGMKTRSDVTILVPFKAVSEIKSPAEAPINLKAVRQAVDAAVQAETNLTMAIGLTTHSGAIDQEKKYFKTIGIGVLLLEIKFISLLVFLSPFIDFSPESLKRLIQNNHGYFGKKEFKKYLFGEIDILKSEIDRERLEKIIEETFI